MKEAEITRDESIGHSGILTAIGSLEQERFSQMASDECLNQQLLKMVGDIANYHDKDGKKKCCSVGAMRGGG